MLQILSGARRGHSGLYGLACLMLALAPVFLVLSAVDDRTVTGAPLWYKPLQFSISFAIYAFTLSLLMAQLKERRLRVVGWCIVVTVAIEMVLISGQAVRGVASHFNTSTSFDTAVWNGMAVTVVILYLANVVLLVQFIREPAANPIVIRAVRYSLGIALLGLAVGFVMSTRGQHAVGVADGGPGLPFVNWSTEGGDLRIGHFVGMHALQVLPLLAFVSTRRWAPSRSSKVVTLSAWTYLVVVVLLIWQALRGDPLLVPDRLITALALITICVFAVRFCVIRRSINALADTPSRRSHSL